jgi:riboflavin kinase/FMN adenylyltransferase
MKTSVKQPVIAIGNFDGVHRGHAALIAAAKRVAVMESRPLLAVTFEPHPRSFFKPQEPSFRITPEHVKERELKKLGVDEVHVLDFNAIMANLTAAQFIDMIIAGHFEAAHVVVGADFHFGKNRGGNVETLSAEKRFQTHAVTLEASGEAPISSTRIREALAAGDIAGANALLGWEWEIEGVVEHGNKKGRELGYPTANMSLRDTLAPAYGVYAVRACIKGEWKPAVANIGIRPMFQVAAPLVETHVFDFSGDLYGQILRVRPVKKLRDEAKFADIEALKVQMAQDCAQARDVLKSPA